MFYQLNILHNYHQNTSNLFSRLNDLHHHLFNLQNKFIKIFCKININLYLCTRTLSKWKKWNH